MKMMLMITAALVLSGCSTRQDYLARDRATCTEIGFVAGSAPHNDCVLELQAARLQGRNHHHW